ncbi:TetR/AcrR family transcriptional regulator [Novosphingobium album (ex Liu et al. 2023)]|uniref:TetR/AcrR family transcriptional regulator n=1 Tax=Novosphingobium album (ex Liu et al. 2023) TaxID=3031130 RepID=A0ABT5WLT9_9SPHN|nr:TetR/AcrR family transcriptional regulator [Novosphingobium album (ex Liu et al. 2023)]MDE8651001.1 TetR/AcrR family transcriptional regulator [Novosphingobium album (ex Liu et al. 2023)]
MNGVTDKRRLSQGAGQRGPAEHERRDQIIRAAEQHIHAVGYRRTSVADLARAIGVSTAYIYKFFDSKRAIGEAICAMTLHGIADKLWSIAEGPGSAEVRLRLIYSALVEQGRAMYFNERQLHEITLVAVEQNWSSIGTYIDTLQQIVRRIVLDGREAGEFERKTPIDEVCGAILQTMAPFSHPVLLQVRLDNLDESAGAVARLVLRSLAP